SSGHLVGRREPTQKPNAADTKTEKIQFRIVDPPQVPVVPAAPNRPLLMTYVLALGIGAGLVTPLLVMQLDSSFATLGQLTNLGVPILGSVSRLSIGAAQRRAALQLIGVTASALVLVAVYGTLLLLSIGGRSGGVWERGGALQRGVVRAPQNHGPPAMLLSQAKFANVEGMANNAVGLIEKCSNFNIIHETFIG